MTGWRLDIGARPVGGKGVRFRVWAPGAERLSVRLSCTPLWQRGAGGDFTDKIPLNPPFPKGETGVFPLEKDEAGYFSCLAEGVTAGARYRYVFDDGSECPDPASRCQPEGVHGPSEVVDPDEYVWRDGGWKGLDLKDLIIYELHVGTFTAQGTFEAIVPQLDYLKDLGVTAIELMPVAQFPGGRNWGYDGVNLFAPQNTYGGPDGLKRLVDSCHGKGIAVVLDVVYNHLGPEGNYLHGFGPYFTDRYKTPWGDAVNFDGPYSDEVRRFFIDNALYWAAEYHIDALRLDAIHGIFDFSARHILEELAGAVHGQAEALGRKVHVMAESDLNDVRVIDPVERGGYGLDAQWNDDFHHSLHTLITGENSGYYQDFGRIKDLEKALREGFVYSGEYSKYRKRRHGSSTTLTPAHKLVVFSQNHDQVGNRMLGDRPSQGLPIEKLKLAAGVVLLSPYVPLLFMGEEYGETAPFQYFVSHSDPALVEAVREGRRREFAAFGWQGEVPDPQAEGTFLRSKIDIGLSMEGKHKSLLDFYRRLIRLRRELPALSDLSKDNMEVSGFEEKRALYVRRWSHEDEVFCLYNFDDKDAEIGLTIPKGAWVKVLDSSEDRGGAGEPGLRSDGAVVEMSVRPHSFVLYRKEGEGL